MTLSARKGTGGSGTPGHWGLHSSPAKLGEERGKAEPCPSTLCYGCGIKVSPSCTWDCQESRAAVWWPRDIPVVISLQVTVEHIAQPRCEIVSAYL